MTSLSTALVALAIGVTSGWAPVEPSSSKDNEEADRYEYLIQLSPADLEAIRSGRVTDLKSYLPEGVGPFDRVRVVFGEQTLPRELTANDARSPRRLAAAGAQRRTVAKPVIPAAWESVPAPKDKKHTPDAGADSEAEKRTAYQNPNLIDGFQDAVAPLGEAGRDLSRQTNENLRRLGRNTEEFFEQGAEGLRRTTENTLRGTGELLENLVPPPNNQRLDTPYTPDDRVPPPAYGQRPGQATSGARTAADWQPTTAPNPNANQPGSDTRPLNTRRPASQATDPNGFASPTNGPTLANPARQDPQQFGNPSFRDDGEGIASRFGSGRSGGESQRAPGFEDFAPVNRGRLSPIGSRDDGFENRARPANDWPTTSPNNWDYADNRQPFRNERPVSSQPPWQPANNQAPYNQPSYNTAAVNQSAANQPPPAGQNQAGQSTGWGDNDLPEFASDREKETEQSTQQTAGVNQSDRMWQSLLLVGLASMNVYVWVSYLDIRNKYRSVLRRNPASYDHNLAA